MRYHTWIKTVRPENIAASRYFSNQLNFIANDKAFYDGQLKIIDEGMSIIADVLDPDLRRVLTPTNYTRSINIFKKQGLIASIAAGKTPFNRATLYGKVIDKALKEKVIAAGASNVMCKMLFNDAATIEACTTESTKIGECTSGIVTDGWGGVSGCVLHGITSVGSAVNSWLAVANVEGSRHRINEYLLINDYLNNYFAKGSLQIPNVDADLNKAIEAYAKKYNFRSNEDLLVILWDYDKSLVRVGIRNGINRVVTKSSANIQLTENLRAILK